MVQIKLKQAGKIIGIVELLPEEPVEVFQAQVVSLTEVEPENQKLLYKGTLLKKETDLAALGIKDQETILVLGTNDKGPGKKPLAVPTEEEAVEEREKMPSGLYNLGNTCYLNAVLQLLFSVGAVQTALMEHQDALGTGILKNLQEIFQELKKGRGMTVTPLPLLLALIRQFPQFSGMDETGRLAQQDAMECWDVIVAELEDKNLGGETLAASFRGLIVGEDGQPREFLDFVLPITEARSLGEAFPMHLNTERCVITKWPGILVLKQGRFFWKKEVQVNAKILKKIELPFVLHTAELAGGDNATEYELVGVLTHQGRSATAGHYMAWVRDKKNTQNWWKLNDDLVSRVSTEEIKALQGGGDWHIACMCLYRLKRK